MFKRNTISKITAVIQARMGSTRLPNKVLLPLEGKPVLWHIVNRLNYCKHIDKIVIATSTNKNDEAIEGFSKNEHIDLFRGSETDLLSRFYDTCLNHDIKIFIRVTADCPFVDFELVDTMIEFYFQNREKCDLLSNVHPATFPDGLDLEIISFEALETAHFEVKDPFYRECFTTYLFNRSEYKTMNYENSTDQSKRRWTLDTSEDYEFVKVVYSELYHINKPFLKKDVEELLSKNPDIEVINKRFTRNYADRERFNRRSEHVG